MTPSWDNLAMTALLAGLRRIFLRDFSLSVSIGIHDVERADRQRILVNVDLFVGGGTTADSIDAVLDYDFLRSEIAGLGASRHFELQETLAGEIARVCMSKNGVLAARVSTEKPDVYPDCEGVGLELLIASDEFRRRLGMEFATKGPTKNGETQDV